MSFTNFFGIFVTKFSTMPGKKMKYQKGGSKQDPSKEKKKKKDKKYSNSLKAIKKKA